MNEKLFRKSSMEKVAGPEQLDDYIRVASPSLWVTLAAVAVLLAAVLVWGAFGALPTTLTAAGVAKDGIVTCYLPVEQAAKVAPGMPAKAGSEAARVSSVARTPLSRAEAAAALQSDYLAETLLSSGWNVPVAVDAPGVPDGVVQVSVTVDTVSPLSFIFN
ncbi:MAG TPA: hypothetical protein VN366_04335 [Feifaniaceae bacterium]|nr:hypothetical protein [Feifaniaceae bacterium]